jgi:hypothetical protein
MNRIGRSKGEIWKHYVDAGKFNSCHKKAICNYCSEEMRGVYENMYRHSINVCKEIAQELRLKIIENRKTQTTTTPTSKNNIIIINDGKFFFKIRKNLINLRNILYLLSLFIFRSQPKHL